MKREIGNFEIWAGAVQNGLDAPCHATLTVRDVDGEQAWVMTLREREFCRLHEAFHYALERLEAVVDVDGQGRPRF